MIKFEIQDNKEGKEPSHTKYTLKNSILQVLIFYEKMVQ